jgi:hypothetical protein
MPREPMPRVRRPSEAEAALPPERAKKGGHAPPKKRR